MLIGYDRGFHHRQTLNHLLSRLTGYRGLITPRNEDREGNARLREELLSSRR
jgi:hypothetical protein